jgi:hypothetical protein
MCSTPEFHGYREDIIIIRPHPYTKLLPSSQQGSSLINHFPSERLAEARKVMSFLLVEGLVGWLID